jgi:regulator of sigma E protease
MLSFILAFMNLLPIPALDGGHVLFLLVEMVRRKPLPEKVMYYFQVVGMVILFALMGFIIFIDFFNAIFN